jgi:hypothetical protein
LAEAESYRQALAITNKRHDLVAVDLHDPLEKGIKNVGLIALEDPETGDIAWVDTGSRTWQKAYRQRLNKAENNKQRAFLQASVDRIDIGTDEDYTIPLTSFFKERSRRIRH